MMNLYKIKESNVVLYTKKINKYKNKIVESIMTKNKNKFF